MQIYHFHKEDSIMLIILFIETIGLEILMVLLYIISYNAIVFNPGNTILSFLYRGSNYVNNSTGNTDWLTDMNGTLVYNINTPSCLSILAMQIDRFRT